MSGLDGLGWPNPEDEPKFMNDDLQELMDKVFVYKNSKDIIKGVVFDRGQATLNGEIRYFSLVGMIIASTEPLVSSHKEFIVMGTSDVSKEIRKLNQYQCPYPFGDISNAIINTSELSPDDLKGLDETEEFE
jgi:hypothetical protein